MYNLMEKRKADVCICNFYNVEGNNKILKNSNKGIQEYDKISILKEILLLFQKMRLKYYYFG